MHVLDDTQEKCITRRRTIAPLLERFSEWSENKFGVRLRGEREVIAKRYLPPRVPLVIHEQSVALLITQIYKTQRDCSARQDWELPLGGVKRAGDTRHRHSAQTAASFCLSLTFDDITADSDSVCLL